MINEPSELTTEIVKLSYEEVIRKGITFLQVFPQMFQESNIAETFRKALKYLSVFTLINLLYLNVFIRLTLFFEQLFLITLEVVNVCNEKGLNITNVQIKAFLFIILRTIFSMLTKKINDKSR